MLRMIVERYRAAHRAPLALLGFDPVLASSTDLAFRSFSTVLAGVLG